MPKIISPLPLVSIIIPTYNRSEFLLRSINSALNQSYPNIEIIVIDDNGLGSTNQIKTFNLLRKFINNNKIYYFPNKVNSNASYSRNIGLWKASGEFIHFLDDDDEPHSNFINELTCYLLKNSKFSGVYCKSQSKIKNLPIYTTSYSKEGRLTFDVFNMTHEFQTSSVLFRKNKIDELMGFDKTFTRSQDLELFIRFFNKNLLGHVDKILIDLNIDDKENRPKLTALIEIKKFFFKKMEHYFNQLSPVEKKHILNSHNNHLFRTALKNLDIRTFYYLFKLDPQLFFKINSKYIRTYCKKIISFLRLN